MSSQHKVVVDTNILFMSIYGSDKAEKILQLANENKIKLFSPISVKRELETILEREFSWNQEKIQENIDALPVIWIEKEIYESVMDKTTVKKYGDKNVEALATILNCNLLTADTDFDKVKQKISTDDFLKNFED